MAQANRTTKTPRTIVVDTSVVRSAGLTDHPVSSACRNCLEAILIICHKVATTEKIKEEWDKHMSNYTRKWRRSMAARKKALVSVVPDSVLLRIDRFTPKSQRAIAKDLRLIEAALATDKVVVTQDDALLAALSETEEGRTLLGKIRWINPVSDPGGIQAL